MMLFNAKQGVLSEQLGTELILYDSAQKVIHVLNNTAAIIFQLCDSSHTEEEIAQALVESFEGIEHVQAYEDVKQMLDVLEAKDLVARENNAGRLRR